MQRTNWSIQHLIYKPLSIYESVEWFWEKYNWILENKPQIKICGDGHRFIGDAALNNLLGMNMCPGEQMFDIDPMGFVRKCPENPIDVLPMALAPQLRWRQTAQQHPGLD